MKQWRTAGIGLGILAAFISPQILADEEKMAVSVGRIERLDPALDALVAPDTVVEKLAEGFRWSEGPVWSRKLGGLLFSDVPLNTVHLWSEKEGLKEYLKPSGFTGSGEGKQGSNGLAIDAKGRLLLCQHGDRRVARMTEKGIFETVADRFEGKRFNSPNDLAVAKDGSIYFTDPPYGLSGGWNSPEREMDWRGVYRVSPTGELRLLLRDLSAPNGIALSPDGSRLYVAISERTAPRIMVYPVKPDGGVGSGDLFFDAAGLVAGREGTTDGLKTDVKGNVFATGPGGVLVLSPEGKHLGTIRTPGAAANCAWGDDGSVLYITCNKFLLRVRTKTKGAIP